MKPPFEVGEIISRFKESFYERHACSRQVRKVFTNLEQCRTRVLGGHVDACLDCGYVRISYNSCRDSHCPKCQGMEREVWIQSRKEELFSGQWVVFCKYPFYGKERVVEYIGRYSHRVGISNSRIKAVDEENVTFDYKDYKQGGRHRLMTLTGWNSFAGLACTFFPKVLFVSVTMAFWRGRTVKSYVWYSKSWVHHLHR